MNAEVNAQVRPPAVWAQLSQPGSALQLALVRTMVGAHLSFVLMSPALPLLARIGGAPHPMAQTSVPHAIEALLSWPQVVWIARTGAVAAVAMAIGLSTRLAIGVVLAAFLITQNYWFRATVSHDDWLYFVFPLLVLSFSRCSDRFAVDAAIRRSPALTGDARSAYRWPIELIVGWFAFLYVAAGIAKLFPLRKGILWLSGRSVQSFAVEFLHDSPLFWLLRHTPFDYRLLWPFTVASLATVMLELGAGALPLLDKRRPLLFLALLCMHASIWALGIPGFVQIGLAFLFAMVPPRAYPDAR